MPLVSVIIPTYRSSFVREAIQSVLDQKQSFLEIIVVDGSPEVTLHQIHDCVGCVRHIPQPPRGVSQARNIGIAAARGDYIALLDADDLWLPDKLQTQLALLSRYPKAGFCFSTTWNLVEGNNVAIPSEPYRPPQLCSWMRANPKVGGAIYGSAYDLLLSVNCIATSSVIAQKAALMEVGLFDEALKNGEDYDLWLRLARSHPVIYVCEPTSRYRVHYDGLSGSWSSRSELFFRTNVRVLEKHMANAPSGMTRRALAQTLADFAGFHLNHAQSVEARCMALRSLRLQPSCAAIKCFIEAAWPRLYSVAARIARASHIA